MILLFGENYEEGVLEENIRRSINEDIKTEKSSICHLELPPDLSRPLLCSIIFVFFAFSVGLSMNETILTPLARDTFGMSVEG